jgi:DNA recombination protein RmuC
MYQIAIIIIGVVIILLLLVVVFRRPSKETDDNSVLILQDQLEKLRNAMENKFDRSQSDIHQTLHMQSAESKKIIADITRELTEVKEGNKQVFSMTEQLSNLQKVLTNQKQRGNWGESSLELILSNIIPSQYQMQYRFEDGTAVDAVVTIKDKLLPIDSKFSLDNYQRCIDCDDDGDREFFAEEFKKDLKKRIEETSKYIKEHENTLPFAFMFIPSEAIYYDLNAGDQSRLKINTQKLMEYARAQKIHIVSPTSILPYLQLVLAGMKAMHIEENAKLIQKKVEDLGKHLGVYEDYMKRLGTTLSTSVNHYNTAYKELKKVDKDVYKITGVEPGIEPVLIDRPNLTDE